MKEVRHGVGQWFEQRQRAGNADAAGQQVGNGERDTEMHDRKTGGFGEVDANWHAHGGLVSAMRWTLVTAVERVHSIVPIASIGAA
jgi:hypothetical protein